MLTLHNTIEILVAPGCTSRKQTEERVEKLLAHTAIKADIKTIVVADAPQANATRFLGSPSVRINGVDIEPEARKRKNYGMG